MKAIVFDTESTGTDPEVDQIIEAAWIEYPPDIQAFLAVKQVRKLPHYCARFKPDVPCKFGALATHHILPSELEDCTPSSLVELPNGVEYIIGHKIDFDVNLMNGGAQGVDPGTRRICTLALARWLLPELDSHTQTALIYYIGAKTDNLPWARDLVKGAHAAYDDIVVCSIILRYLLRLILNRGFTCDTWDELAELSDTARIPTKMDFGKHKGELVADVPRSYVGWYKVQADTDPYYIEAFRRAGKL